jgi:hypothetical protein
MAFDRSIKGSPGSVVSASLFAALWRLKQIAIL